MTKAERISYYKNPFIGIFTSATEKYAFVPFDAPKKLTISLEEILEVETIKCSVGMGSTLLGAYVRGNSNGILVPSDSTDSEIKEFKKLGLNVEVIDAPQNALGNIVAANDNAAIINENLKSYKKQISNCLNVEVFETPLIAGANMVVTNKGLLLNSDYESMLKKFEEIFKVRGNIGTANFGVPYVGICMIANSKGFLIGDKTSGYELGRIEDALGFLG